VQVTAKEIERIVDLLMTGQCDDAIAVAEALLHADPDDSVARLYRGMAFLAKGQFEDAIADFDETARMAEAEENVELTANAAYWRGVAHARKEDWTLALPAFEAAAKAVPPNGDLCAALCETLCRLNRFEEALVWRRRAIEIRDRNATCDQSKVVSGKRPKVFDPSARKRNIVSYSLFGADRYYHQCAITVARMTLNFFPEFTARFYCAPDIPRYVRNALAAAEAEVLMVGSLKGAPESPFAGIFWRFLAFDDPNVDVVLVRDVDSPILRRERAGIDLWLSSNAPFYCLRDSPIHAEPMLAGMWGGFTGLLPKIGPLCYQYAVSDHSRFADQRFLREVIWPRIRDATLSIDSDNALGTSVDFPDGFPKSGALHVGMGWTRQQILGA
jgi:hypothetical protein